jgi:multiple sugar transport system ATP-binding protein
MNLIDGEMTDGVFTADGVRIEGLPQVARGPVTLGYRAEDASVTETGGEVAAPIYSIELLGDATMVTVRIADGTLLSVRAAKDYRAEIDDPVCFAVPAGICHLFDRETGKRIAA